MTPSSIRTRLVQLEVLPGLPRQNTENMLRHVAAAIGEGIELLVFPEMAIPGYLIGDEWERQAFLRECERCGDRLRQAAQGIILIFGNVAIDWEKHNEDGRVRKYIALFAAEDGQFISPSSSPYPYVTKTLLPNYREFDDSRHFFDSRKLSHELGLPPEELISPIITASGISLGCMLCEDAWDTDYALTPPDTLAAKGADLLVNISTSPFTMGKNHKRNRLFSKHSTRLQRPFIYVNNVGIQNNGKTVFTFDGSSCIYDGHGNSSAAAPIFEDTCTTLDIPLDRTPFGTPVDLRTDSIAELYKALIYGTRKFMQLCAVERVTIGISGGIDSAIVAAIYAEILPRENILLVNMPSRFNSATTRSLATQLAENIGSYYTEIPIEDSVALTSRQVDSLEIGSPDNVPNRKLTLTPFMIENVQARDRSSRILASISAAFGGIFTCNANKSEVTVGYTTLYGDLCGFLANIADLWKTEVYELARHINSVSTTGDIIPTGSIDIVPSAELSAEQDVDKNQGDPLMYPYHDCLFRSWVEWWNRCTPEEILDWYINNELEAKLGYDGDIEKLFSNAREFIADLERWWNLYQGMGLAKRIQAPPILAVKRRAFGFDHRESQMGPRYTSRYDELKRLILAPGQ